MNGLIWFGVGSYVAVTYVVGFTIFIMAQPTLVSSLMFAFSPITVPAILGFAFLLNLVT